MIKLTRNAQFNPEIHLLNKTSILIGDESTYPDFVLPGIPANSALLKITQENQTWIAYNLTNDPFVSLNGLPFGKKRLNSGDSFDVYDQTILFEDLQNQSQTSSSEEKENQKFTNIQPNETSHLITSFPLPFENEVSALEEQEWKNHQEKNETSPQHEEQKEVHPRIILKNSRSLKDDYLRDLDDDNQEMRKAESFKFANESGHLYQAWKWILLFIFSLLAIFALMGAITYYNVSDKTEDHVSIATQGTADIAMALTYAQLSQTKPLNQNWSDIGFLKMNLQNLLPDTRSFGSRLDAQGNLNCCPYTLRVYTNSDLSHFLLIAQPAPTLLYWLIPKPIIVIDSKLMEIRYVNDIRSLNRLLTNPDPLEKTNGKELTSLIKNGELISLKWLATETKLPEFAPPKNILLDSNRAENLIYNAPRYHRLGLSLIEKALNLSDSKLHNDEASALKKELLAISWLKDFILYSPNGKESAEAVRNSLNRLAPQNEMIFGYLEMNDEGKINEVGMLPNVATEKKTPSLLNHSTEDPFQEVAFSDHPAELNDEQSFNHAFILKTDYPAFVQLQALLDEREHELKPLVNDLNESLKDDVRAPSPKFQVEFLNKAQHYAIKHEEYDHKIEKIFELFHGNYPNVSSDDFSLLLKAFHLAPPEQPKEKIALQTINIHSEFETLMNKLKQISTLAELCGWTEESSGWLACKGVKNTSDLSSIRNKLRNGCLDQLERFLCSGEELWVSPEDRQILEQILNQEEFITSEEKEFFLQEFEFLCFEKKKNKEGKSLPPFIFQPQRTL